MMAAVSRGLHRIVDPRPWVLDDPYALRLIGREWTTVHRAMSAVFSAPVLRQANAAMVTRARYTEDALRDGAFTQYVVLGAGLDSLAWREPDLLPTVRIIEIDHPSTQAWKQQRMRALGLAAQAGHVLAPVDFETDTVRDGLDAAGFDWSRPALFSWLGVTQYLSVDAIRETLRVVASCAPGSEIVLTYVPTIAHLDTLGRQFVTTLTRVAEDKGEPLRALLEPAEALALIEEGSALRVREHLTRDDLHVRYFARRSDRLTPPSTLRMIAAVVPEPRRTASG